MRMYSREKERNEKKKTASSWPKERVVKGKELCREPVRNKENHRVH